MLRHVTGRPAALVFLATSAALLSGCAMQSREVPRGSESDIVAGRYVVVYRDGFSAAGSPHAAAQPGRLGFTVYNAGAAADDTATIANLSALPGVTAVLHDRIVRADALSVAPPSSSAQSKDPYHAPILIASVPDAPIADVFYNSPQGWAVRAAGGYGASVPGGPASGPWNSSMGAGVRIAVLDSGVDATHPDIAPNLGLNLSLVDTTALPSACDDGSPQDQQGHGTWTASLAAGALGPTTGGVIGVAPQATLLNIKVLERLPGTNGNCSAGQPGGLLSWVLAGIQSAIDNHAGLVQLSLGSIVDTWTGDGAGWKAQFDRATHAATNAGIIVIAAAGNDSLDLSGGRYLELPAQSRDVLAVVATTNPACAENLTLGALCQPGPVTRPTYSNHGMANAIAAPGGNSPSGGDNGVSGFIRGACSSTNCFDQGPAAYAQAAGSSASSALTVGAAALLRSAHPTWTPAQVIGALISSGDRTVSLAEPLLDTSAALAVQP